jgi:hypothetical protein
MIWRKLLFHPLTVLAIALIAAVLFALAVSVYHHDNNSARLCALYYHVPIVRRSGDGAAAVRVERNRLWLAHHPSPDALTERPVGQNPALWSLLQPLENGKGIGRVRPPSSSPVPRGEDWPDAVGASSLPPAKWDWNHESHEKAKGTESSPSKSGSRQDRELDTPAHLLYTAERCESNAAANRIPINLPLAHFPQRRACPNKPHHTAPGSRPSPPT